MSNQQFLSIVRESEAEPPANNSLPTDQNVLSQKEMAKQTTRK